MNNTCSLYKDNFLYKGFILLLLILCLSFSAFVYYKSLKSMKHNELDAR